MKNLWRYLLPLLVFLIFPFPRASAKVGDLHSENGFTGKEREIGDGFLSITLYEGTLGDDGKLDIPETITDSTGTWEVREIDASFVTKSNLRASLKELRLPEGLQVLGRSGTGIFANCESLESVYIPSTLETATSPFSGCAKLDNVEFGVSLPRVPSTLFSGCTGLTKIELPRMTTVVGERAFLNCSNLESITFHTSNYLTEIQASAFQGCTALTALSLPNGLQNVGNSAFAGCSALKEVNMPEGLRTLGASVFASCTALERVHIPASLETAGSATAPVFSGCSSLNKVEAEDFGSGTTSIIDNLFAKCNGLKQITIPKSVVSIESGAFAESGLTSIEIPNNVISYGVRAFRNCASLTRAELSNMAPVIPERMFYQCYFLQSVSVKLRESQKTDDPDTTVTSIGKEAFYECKRLTDLPKWGVLNSIGVSAFYRCETLASISLSESLTSLGANAFQHNHMLNMVVIPTMITEIPQYAFAQCYALTDIVIPKSVKAIADYAFYQDTGLKRVFIPASVTSISDKEAFSYIDKMTIEGVTGSYAQDWAKRKNALTFVDKSVPIKTISLAGGGDSMILPRSCVVAPVFDVEPVDNTDVLTLTSSDSSVAVRNGYILYCTRNLTSPVTITATATSGLSFDFTVTCEDMTKLEVVPPEITDYAVGDAIDWTGFVPEAVFNSGARQPIYNYPPSADTIRDKVLEWTASGFESSFEGTKTVTVNYSKFSATFPVEVYASASQIPVSFRRVERTESGFRVLTHGVAGNAKLCALFSFDANNRYLGVEFKTLTAADTSAGFADFAAASNAASVKTVLLNGNTLAPAVLAKTLSVA